MPTFRFDHGLLARRGVNRWRLVASSRRRACASIQPKHSASSRASWCVSRVGRVVPFFARTSQTPSGSAWCFASQARQARTSLTTSSRRSSVTMAASHLEATRPTPSATNVRPAMGLLEGKGAVVTGGGSGIGLATARRFAAEGARVVVHDFNEELGKRAADEVGGEFVRCDVSQSTDVAEAFRQSEEHLGRIDIAHLNAGIVTGRREVEQLTDDEYRRIMGINLDGVVFGMREAIRTMERGSGGVIVATASLAGLTAYPTDPIYSLTKHGVVGLVRGVAPQLEGRGIRVNCVCPGITDTPILGESREVLVQSGFPLITPEEIAEGVVRAATSEGTGEAWVCQAGREPMPYGFRGVPGPRTPGKEGMAPPDFRA